MTLEQKIEALENLKLSQAFDWHHILDEHITDYNDLMQELENQGLMKVEIIYYTNAIDYLKEHDPSLQTSMNLALELEEDFSNNSFSSETLASILATQHLYDELSENHDAINEILEDDGHLTCSDCSADIDLCECPKSEEVGVIVPKKYLMTLEFRYSDAPKFEHSSTSQSKTLTIAVCDTFEEACERGNSELEILESNFKLNPNYNRTERFSLNGGCFGSKTSLIANLGYLQTPFDFYAKITTLNYGNTQETIDSIKQARQRYLNYKDSENE